MIRRIAANFDIGRRSEEFRSALRNSVFNSADHLLLPLLWLVSTPIFIAELGTARFGLWMVANSAIGLGGVMSLGLSDATVKFVAKHRARGDIASVARIVRGTLALYSVLGLVTATAIAAVAPWLAETAFRIPEAERAVAVNVLRLAALCLFLQFVQSVYRSAIEGFERYDLGARAMMILNALTTVVNVGIVVAGHGLVYVFANIALLLLVGTVILRLEVRRLIAREHSLFPRIDWATFEEIRSFSFYNWAHRALGIVNERIDRIIIAALIGTAAVSYYSVCQQLAGQVHSLLARASAFLFPMSGILHEHGHEDRLRRIYHKATFVIVVLSSGLIMPILLLNRELLTVWLGPEFAERGAAVLIVFAVRYALTPMGIVNYHFLLGSGRPQVLAAVALLSAPMQIAAMFALAPYYGIVGVALGQLVAMPFMVFTRLYISKVLFGEYEVKELASYLLAVTSTMAVAALWLAFGPGTVASIPQVLGLVCAYGLAGLIICYATASACRWFGWLPRT